MDYFLRTAYRTYSNFAKRISAVLQRVCRGVATAYQRRNKSVRRWYAFAPPEKQRRNAFKTKFRWADAPETFGGQAGMSARVTTRLNPATA